MSGKSTAPRVTTDQRLADLKLHQIVIPVVVGLTLAGIALYWGSRDVTESQNFYGALYRNGAHANAVVLRTDPDNHDRVQYSYEVNGKTYTSWSYALGPDGTARELRVGQSIRIVYDRTHPEVSCDCIPTASDAGAGSTISSQITLVVVILLAIPIAIVFSGGWQPEVTTIGLLWYRRGTRLDSSSKDE